MQTPFDRRSHRRIGPQLSRAGRTRTHRRPEPGRSSRDGAVAGSGNSTAGEHAAAPRAVGEYETGTTTVAVSAADGVVMAADRRMSLGNGFAASKDVRKIEQVHPSAAVAIAGTVGPAQQLLAALRAEAALYESRRGEPMSMTALSQTAGHVVRGLPVRPLLGGVDDAGGHVYELDGGGSVIKDNYAASGSGMQLAYGVLEGRVSPDLATDDAAGAAIAAVEAASERDGASGNGVTVARITRDGVAFDGGAS